MYLLHHNGETTVHDDHEQAIEHLLEQSNATLKETKLTPEVMTIRTPEPPFSAVDKQDQIIHLFDTLAVDSPVGEIAREHVLSELETTKRYGAPDDLSPTESDQWEYDVRRWFEDRVDRNAFDDEVVETVEQQLVDATRDEVHAVWSDVSDRIGNPARASDSELEQEIERLSDGE